MRRRWQLVGVLAVALAGLVLAGRILAPPAAPRALSFPVHTGPSCQPQGPTKRPVGPTDGPQLHPPVAGLRLALAAPRAGDISADRARELARDLVSRADGVTTRARYLEVTRPPSLRRVPAWVVAVANAPVGMGFCGLVGSHEVVVALDPTTGRELLRYSYR
jgi:hypothetical protein